MADPLLIPVASPDPGLTDTNDTTGEYSAYREQQNQQQLDQGLRNFAAPPPKVEQPAKPDATMAGSMQLPATPEAQKPQTMLEALTNPRVRPEDKAGLQYQGGSMEGIKKAAPDIGMGLATEIPRAATKGLLNAASAIESGLLEVAIQGGKAIEGTPWTWPLTNEQQSKLIGKVQELQTAIRAAPDVVDDPKTVTGNLISGAVQFMSVMGKAGSIIKAMGAAPAIANTLGGGVAMSTAFEGADSTLAEMIQSQPGLANPVAEFLSTKPGDSEAVKRLKNGVEGVLGGFVAEGFSKALSLYKEAKAPVVQEGATPAPSKVELPELAPERDFLLLGDAKAPLVSVKDKPADPVAKIGAAMEKVGGVDQGAAAKGLTKDAQAASNQGALGFAPDYGNKSVTVNFNKINTPDDVKLALGQMTEAFSGDIKAAQRGVRSNELTQQVADGLGMTVEDVLRRRFGQPFNAEEAVAARNLMAASGQKLLEVAQKAASPGATPADQFMFRKMMATHYAIQAEVLGARTETARALQAWSIPAGGGQQQMKALQELLTASGGSDVSQEMAKRLAMLAESGADPAAINTAIRKGAFATTVDAVKEIWINGLLWSPTTHIVNAASNFNVMMQSIVERGVAGQIAKATGSGGVAEGEAAAMAYGMLTSVKDAFREAGKTLIGKGSATSKMEDARVPAFGSQAFDMTQGTGAARVVDYLGSTLRLPGTALATEDAFFKTIGYRMELHAQAYRQASSEGLQGYAFGKRVAELTQNPPDNIKIASADQALYNTFQQAPGKIGQGVMTLRNSWTPLQFILPFVRTPVNVARYSFERTPLAPLVGQWRADIAAGGARKDIALARMATGSAAMSIAADFAQQGMVSGSGPKDPGERNALLRTGWQPYSCKIGDKWYSYNRTDPFGQTLGAAADLTEALRAGEVDPGDAPEWDKVTAGVVAAASQFTINKTYLRGLADFTNFMTDYQRYGESYTDNFVASFLPFNTALATAERITDPTVRVADTPMDAAMSKIPGLSTRLTEKLDLWGQPINANPVGGAAFNALSPIKVTKADASPIDAEMLKQQAFVAPIGKKTNFLGVPVDFREFPRVYEAYVKMSGNALNHPVWGKGAKDFLSETVQGKGPLGKIYSSGVYSDGPDGTKADFIKQTVREYRDLAAQAIMRDPKFSDFANYVSAQQAAQMQMQIPGGQR